MPEATNNPQRKIRGQRILAITGLALSLMTLAGGACQFYFDTALWARLFFAVSISGLVGFATNWLAIKMLFHPRVKVLGFQGVVPSRRKELARSVGETLEEHLISGDRMHKLLVSTGAVDQALQRLASHLPSVLGQPEARELVTREVASTIQDTMVNVVTAAKDKLREKSRSNLTALLTGTAAATTFGPMAGLLAAGITKSGMFDTMVGKLIDDMVSDLKQDGSVNKAAAQVVDQLPQRAEHLLNNEILRVRMKEQFSAVAEELLKAVDVASLIEGELLGRDEGELEDLIDRVAASELVFIQVAGGALGMIAGVSLVWPWMLLPIGGALLVMIQVARVAEQRHARLKAEKETTAPAPEVVNSQALATTPVHTDTPLSIEQAVESAPEPVESTTQPIA
ncbi:MAG: DUF445 family protein [Planctomycetes bacterium]|nr:DUF445 family protein [Planctomycetota bacterium]